MRSNSPIFNRPYILPLTFGTDNISERGNNEEKRNMYEMLDERNLRIRHERVKKLYPSDRLIVVFDIDDTILDLRHMILHVLSAFDVRHETRYFRDLSIRDIGASEFEVHRMMAEFGIPVLEQQKVIEWFAKHSWSKPVIRDSHRPFPGAMEVIRWLQSRKKTFVGLNTGRPETMRQETLQSLNRIGRPLDVVFHDHLLFMNPHPLGGKGSRNRRWRGPAFGRGWASGSWPLRTTSRRTSRPLPTTTARGDSAAPCRHGFHFPQGEDPRRRCERKRVRYLGTGARPLTKAPMGRGRLKSKACEIPHPERPPLHGNMI